MPDELRLLIGTEEGLLALSSRDGGKTWSAPERLLAEVEAHALRAGPDGAVYLGTRGHGLFRSIGELRSWEQIETPETARKVRSLCLDGDRLLVGTEAGPAPVGVYAWSAASGWEAVGDLTTCPGAGEWFYPAPFEDVHIRHVSVDPHQPGRIYAAVQVGGVGISPDNGDSWYDRRNLDVDVHMVEPHPVHPGVLYAGSGGSGSGLYRSSDYGESWGGIAEGCGNFVVQFALDRRDPDRLYLGTARGRVPDWANPGGAKGEMFRSEDGGTHWLKLAGGLPEFLESRVNVVLVDHDEPNNVYFGGGLPSGSRNPGIARDAGVYHSPDRGETWRQIFSLDHGEPLALWCARV